MKAKGLHGDLRYAIKLVRSEVQVVPCIFTQRSVADEIKKISDRLERIIDLMRNGRSKTTGDSKLLGAAQKLLRLLLQGQIGDEGCELAPFWSGVWVQQRHPHQHLDTLRWLGLASQGPAGCFERLAQRDTGVEKDLRLEVGKEIVELDRVRIFKAVDTIKTEEPLGRDVGVKNIAVGVGDQQAEGHSFHQAMEPILRRLQGQLRRQLFTAIFGFFQFALHRRHKTREILLGDIILCTRPASTQRLSSQTSRRKA